MHASFWSLHRCKHGQAVTGDLSTTAAAPLCVVHGHEVCLNRQSNCNRVILTEIESEAQQGKSDQTSWLEQKQQLQHCVDVFWSKVETCCSCVDLRGRQQRCGAVEVECSSSTVSQVDPAEQHVLHTAAGEAAGVPSSAAMDLLCRHLRPGSCLGLDDTAGA